MNTKSLQINNLDMIRKVGFRGDMLYRDSQNRYYVTCVHGNEHGTLSLQGDFFCTESTNSSRIRRDICNFYNYRIPEDAIIFITPCYPNAARREKGDVLAKRNVYILGEWANETYWGQCNSETMIIEESK